MTLLPPRLYRIQDFHGHFHAGHLGEEVQAFLGVHGTRLIAVLFDPAGDYRSTLVKDLLPEVGVTSSGDDAAVPWAAFRKDWEALNQWAVELGLTAGTIAVQKFSLPDYDLRIQDLPSIYQELLDSSEQIVDSLEE